MASAHHSPTESLIARSNHNSNGDQRETNKEWCLDINKFNTAQEPACLHRLTSLSSAITIGDTVEDTIADADAADAALSQRGIAPARAIPAGRVVLVITVLPWDVRRCILACAGEVAAVRLGRACRGLHALVRSDAGLWQQFYAQSFLRDAQRVEHEFLEWCSEERAGYYKPEVEDPVVAPWNGHHSGRERRGGAFADAHARWKLASYAADTPTAANTIAEERGMDWYAAYRRRAATEANWCAGRYVRHSIPAPAIDVRTVASLYALGVVTAPRMVAGSAAGILLLRGDRLYCVYQPCSQDAAFYKLEELDLEAETAGILQVRAAHMSGQWIVVELHDPQYPEAGGSLSAWRIGSRQASCAAELKESGERVQEVRGRWALLTRRQQSATIFTVVDLELGLRSIGELRVQCRSAEILHVDGEKVHLLVNEHVDGQRDEEESDTGAAMPVVPLAQEMAFTYLSESVPPTASTSTSTSTGTSMETASETSTPSSAASAITCAIYCLSLESLPMLVTLVKLPSPPRMLCRSLRIRVIDTRRILLEYIESGSFDVRVVVHRLNISLASSSSSSSSSGSNSMPISQLSPCNDGDSHAVVLISWYRRRPVVIRDCTAIWTKMNAHDAAAGYLISPSLGRSGLLFHSEYFEGDATLMDMATWQPQCHLGYWPPAAGPNLVTPTFIARMKEGDGGLEVWNFAAW